MDNGVLRKRLNTYKSGKKGQLRNVSDEVVMEVLRAWENWPGTSADLYRELGLSKMQLVILIKKAKQLVKAGVVPEPEFKEVKVEEASAGDSCRDIISVRWDNNKFIRFRQVDQLVDFLKKVS